MSKGSVTHSIYLCAVGCMLTVLVQWGAIDSSMVPARSQHSAVSTRPGQLVLFGGQALDGVLGDTWVLTVSPTGDCQVCADASMLHLCCILAISLFLSSSSCLLLQLRRVCCCLLGC